MLCGATATPERGGIVGISLAGMYRQNHMRADIPLFPVIHAPSRKTSESWRSLTSFWLKPRLRRTPYCSNSCGRSWMTIGGTARRLTERPVSPRHSCTRARFFPKDDPSYDPADHQQL